jgi:ubiquinone/menaquinone biosynthesis C-methylase UbiE
MKTISVLLILGLPAAAQVAAEANKRYQTVEGRMGMLANLGAPDRAVRLQGQRIVEVLGLRPGMTVADIGTGGGAMLPLLSAAVGATGKVVAQDIFADFLEAARKKAAEEKLSNVDFVLGNERDSKLPAGCCDLAVTIDAYHHFDYPGETLASIRRGLKPGGRLVIVDYYKRPGAMSGVDAVEHVRLDMDDAIREVESFGFRLLEKREHVKGSQWIGFFTPR